MTLTKTKLLTAADLLQLYSEGVRGELIQGVLCETLPSGGQHGEIIMNLGGELRNFIKPRRLGRLAGSDSGVWLDREPDTVREPDIAFISAEKIPQGTIIRGYYEVIPDLVVEVKSPSDSRREVYDKARMWLSFGVRLVWTLFPEEREVNVHSENAPMSRLTDADTLDGGDILPGFTYKVSDIFDTDL